MLLFLVLAVNSNWFQILWSYTLLNLTQATRSYTPLHPILIYSGAPYSGRYQESTFVPYSKVS